jgi:hypothetical protein
LQQHDPAPGAVGEGLVGVELRARLPVERRELAQPRLAAGSALVSMSIPNGVPQSPMWFWRTTRCPSRSSTRTRESPMIVLRRWPTCICFATFGAE